MITGGSGRDRFQYFLDEHLPGRLPVARAITLGCGTGDLERGLSKYGFAAVHEAVDLSDHAILAARQAAAAQQLRHIQYRAADLNSLRLEPDSYDVVFGVSSIHHVENLENLFSQVHAALRPGGLFFLDEYVGPTRFQWTDVQLRLMNEQLRKLPESLRRSVSERGKVKTEVIRKTLDYMKASDPSEAVRSADIVPLLRQHFKVVEFKGYGGSLLHELLFDIAGNFAQANDGSLARLEELFRIEDDLLESGTLPHDFAYAVATTA